MSARSLLDVAGWNLTFNSGKETKKIIGNDLLWKGILCLRVQGEQQVRTDAIDSPNYRSIVQHIKTTKRLKQRRGLISKDEEEGP